MKESKEEQRRMKEMYNLEQDMREVDQILVNKLTPSERATLTRVARGLWFTQEPSKQKMTTMVQKRGDDAKKGGENHHADGISSGEEEGLRLRSKKVVIKKQQIIGKKRKASSDDDDDDHDYVPPPAMVDLPADFCVDFSKKNERRISTSPPPLPLPLLDSQLPYKKRRISTSPPLPLPLLDSQLPYKKRRISNGIPLSEPIFKEARLTREKSLKKQEKSKREKLLIKKKPEQPKKRTQPKKKMTTTTKITYRGPATPPNLPIEFKNKITEMGGTESQLVIQKPLYTTDLNHNHSRLSIPLSQIIAKNFLRDEEYAFLNKQSKGNIPSIDVGLIDTRLEIWGTCFKRWNLKKKNGKVSPTYVLTSTWNDLVDSNNLNCGDILQVWSFRVNGQLRLALVLVQKVDAAATAAAEEGSSGVDDTGIGSSSSGSRSKEDTQEQE